MPEHAQEAAVVPQARLVHVATLLQLVVLCVAPSQCHAELVALHHEDETQPSEVPRSCHETASGLLGQRLIANGRGCQRARGGSSDVFSVHLPCTVSVLELVTLGLQLNNLQPCSR